MSEILHLRAADARQVPWKNGRGFTSELALWPRTGSFERDEFEWRLSKASIDEPGPFSSFPGIERLLVVTDGAGLVLEHAGAAPRKELARLQPYRFQGEWITSADLVAGPVSDFNVLCRTGRARAEVECWDGELRTRAKPNTGEHLFLHVLSGDLEARTSDRARPWRLASGESLWLAPPDERELALAGSCRALLVRISPTGALSFPS
ncbi:MAG: HutD family protein [Planctomycetes bacterium]|nr:HutD family protein [Planctomycetota bacterium]